MLYIYMAIAFLVLFISIKLFADVFSPIAIMGFIWMLVFSLYQLRLYPYNDLEPRTWLHIFTGLGMFFVGCLLAFIVVKAVSRQSSFISHNTLIDERKLFKLVMIFWVLGTIGFCILFFRIIFLYGLHTYLEDPQKIHDDFTLRFIGYLWMFNIITPTLAIIHAVLSKRKRILMVFIFCTSMFWLLFSVSRSNNIRALYILMLSLAYLKLMKHEVRNLIIIGSISILFFISYAYLKDPDHGERLKRLSFEPKILRDFASAYGYFTTPMTVYGCMENDVKEFDYGTNTFITVVKVLNSFGFDFKVNKSTEQKYYSNPIRCNVYTFLGIYYKDFGFPGVVILCFFQGILVMFFYSKMKLLNYRHLFLLNANFAWCLFISFFSNHFVGNTSLFLMLLSYFAGKYIIVYGEDKAELVS